MKLFKPGTPESARLFGLLLLIYVAVVTIMNLLNWPRFFVGWEGKIDPFITSIRMSLVGIILLVFIMIWLLTHKSIFTEVRKNVARQFGILFFFIILPIGSLLKVAIPSDGFTINPISDPELMKLYYTIDQIILFVMIGLAISYLIYMFSRKKTIDPQAENGQLHPS